jgi:hypothetical protein
MLGLRATDSKGLRVCTYNSNPIAHPNPKISEDTRGT